MDSFVYLLLFIFFLLGISIVYDSIRNGISPMPSSQKAKKAIIELIPKEAEGTFLELGSGWGTLAFPIAEKFPLRLVIAYENSWVPYFFSKCRVLFQPRNNLKILKQDFMEADFSKAHCIVCYLYPKAMMRLKKKFEKEFSSPVWIISNTFAIPGWTPTETIILDDLYQTKIYKYQYVPKT